MGARSGGCRTCRRRRVKCDERRPDCERCEKGRFKCDGYAREHRFIDENAKVERSVEKARDLSRRGAQGQGRLSSHTHEKTLQPTEIVQIAQYRQSLPVTLGYAAFEDNIYVSFLISHLFEGRLDEWLNAHVQDQSSTSGQMSTRALGAMYFGRMHNRHDITRRASELYGKALVSLNQDLRDEKNAYSTTILTTAYALELYEFMTSGSSFGWLKHAGGIGKLIQLRGPWRHQSTLFRHFLEANRVTIALECLVMRKRCFLEDPDWKIIPWALDPNSKISVFYLHDILVDIPGLMEDVDMLQHMNDEMPQHQIHFASLSRKIIDHIRALYEWRASWQQMHPDSAAEVLTSALSEPETYPSPTVLAFSSIDQANEIMFYNTLLLVLMRLGIQVIGPEFDSSLLALDLPTGLDYSPLHGPGLAPNMQAIATEICRGVEYHMNDGNRSIVALFLLFPLRVAYQTFEPDSREAHWLGNILGKIADITPFKFSRGLNQQKWP